MHLRKLKNNMNNLKSSQNVLYNRNKYLKQFENRLSFITKKGITDKNYKNFD